MLHSVSEYFRRIFSEESDQRVVGIIFTFLVAVSVSLTVLIVQLLQS